MEPITAWAYREYRGNTKDGQPWLDVYTQLNQYVRALKPNGKKCVERSENLILPNGEVLKIGPSYDHETNQILAVRAFCINAIYYIERHWPQALDSEICLIPIPSKNPLQPRLENTQSPSLFMATEMARLLKQKKRNATSKDLLRWKGLDAAHSGGTREKGILYNHIHLGGDLPEHCFPILIDDLITRGSQISVCAAKIQEETGLTVALALCGASTLDWDDEPTGKSVVREVERFTLDDVPEPFDFF